MWHVGLCRCETNSFENIQCPHWWYDSRAKCQWAMCRWVNVYYFYFISGLILNFNEKIKLVKFKNKMPHSKYWSLNVPKDPNDFAAIFYSFCCIVFEKRGGIFIFFSYINVHIWRIEIRLVLEAKLCVCVFSFRFLSLSLLLYKKLIITK